MGSASILGFIFTILYAINVTYSQICRIDLGIILDDSGSIKRWGFEQEKGFIRSLTRQLRISGDNTRVSVMTFSTHARMRIFFRDRSGQNWNSLNWALNGIRHSGGWTYTDKALHLARTHMFNTRYGSRSGAPKMLLLLTDGKSQSGHSKLAYAANLLKNNFVNIISIGVGRQIRRSELELMASRPIHQHVFQVRDTSALSRIVNTVRTEACKPITCWYIDCIYNEWSAWSGTCHTVTRTRTVRLQVRKSKMVVGGCAGLNVVACKNKVETKNLGVCLQKCNYVKCFWAQWGAWSASCGRATRQRLIQPQPAVTHRRTCHGLPQRCYERPQTQNRHTQCSCKYVDCQYGPWSAWTTSCGKGQRSRRLQAIQKTKNADSCAGLPQTCSTQPQIQRRTEMCTCRYVECPYGPWSQWTTSCGKGQRSRKRQPVQKSKQAENCNGLPQTCSAKPEIEQRTKMCSCSYVDCPYGPWSQWTTSCGKGQRSRKREPVQKTKQAENCNGLPQTCSAKPEIEQRTKMCSCNYVECPYGPWTQWTTSCGKGQRARKMQPVQKTKQAASCDGLPKTCSTTQEIEQRTKMCTCNYVECPYGPWSAWTTSCGKGQRGRKRQAVQKTKQAESCNGLPQTCSDKPDIEERTKLCKCDYVECKYSQWSEWKPKCGKNMVRSRTLQTIKKSVDKENCNGLPQSCTGDAEQTEKKDELCECDTVKCVMQWSAWSASCGLATRTMRFVKVPIKVKKESCEGLPQSCSNATETQTDDLFCEKTKPPVTSAPPSDALCNARYKPIGCFKDNKGSRSAMQKILFVDPYENSKSFGFSDYLSAIVCRCATKAKLQKFDVFAISPEGQCIAGIEGDDSWRKQSATFDSDCKNAREEECEDVNPLCIGKESTLFAYSVVR